MKNILALSPHPDDIELGAGGFLAKHKNLCLDVIVFSNCEEHIKNNIEYSNLMVENLNSLNHLNPNNIYNYYFKVRNFKESRQNILDAIISISKLKEYDLVLTPARSDEHQDHQVVTEECIRFFKSKATILGYCLPWNNLSESYCYFEVLSKENVEHKILCLSEYKSQKDRNYFKEDNIRSTLKYHGQKINKEYAEPFEIIRMINK